MAMPVCKQWHFAFTLVDCFFKCFQMPWAMPLHLEWHHFPASIASFIATDARHPVHLEQHHFQSFYCFLVDCFSPFVHNFGCHISLQQPLRLIVFFFCFRMPGLTPLHPERSTLFVSDATYHNAASFDCFLFWIASGRPTSSGVMPLHLEQRHFPELLLPGWLFFPFFHNSGHHISLQQMPTPLQLIDFFFFFFRDATTASVVTPLHPEQCHSIQNFYWFLVDCFFPIFSTLDATFHGDGCQCHFGWLFFYATMHLEWCHIIQSDATTPLHLERCHFIQSTATMHPEWHHIIQSNATMPLHLEWCHFIWSDATSSGAFIASWLIVFFFCLVFFTTSRCHLSMWWTTALKKTKTTPLHKVQLCNNVWHKRYCQHNVQWSVWPQHSTMTQCATEHMAPAQCTTPCQGAQPQQWSCKQLLRS